MFTKKIESLTKVESADNSVSELMKSLPNHHYSTLHKLNQKHELLCHTLGSIRHHVETEDSSSATWIKKTIDDMVNRLKTMV